MRRWVFAEKDTGLLLIERLSCLLVRILVLLLHVIYPSRFRVYKSNKTDGIEETVPKE